MNPRELSHLIAAVIILTLVFSLSEIIRGNLQNIPFIFIFSSVIVFLAVFSKKLIASLLDSNVEHELWFLHRLSLTSPFKKPIAVGLIIPIILSVISLGFIKFASILTYETRALKRRAAKRHGFYSYTEMTDFENAIIGSTGIVVMLLLSLVAYLVPSIELLSKIAAYYAFWNMLPISKLDGTQIFFGSRVIYAVLAIITIIFALYALLII